MYKLIITDDEDTILNGLSRFVNWKELGYELVALFKDGRETLDYLSENDVDVVLTDIKMNEVSGLEVAKFVYLNKSDTKVVILSGYKEFEYAKKAIEYNVEFFLTKPTDLDEISSVFKKIKTSLDAEKARKEQEKKERERFNELLPLLIEQFFTDLVTGNLYKKGEIEKRAELIEFDLDINNCCCSLININVQGYNQYVENTWEYGKEGLNTALRNFFREENKEVRCYPIFNNYEQFMIVAVALRSMSESEMKEILTSQLEEICKTINSFFELKIDYTIEGFFDNLFHLAEHTFLERTANNENGIKKENVLDKKRRLLISNLTMGYYEEALDMLENLMDDNNFESFEHQKEFVIDLYENISGKYAGMGIDLRKVTGGIFEYQSVLKKKNVAELHTWAREMLQIVIKCLENSEDTSAAAIIKKATDYIKKNCAKDISLEDVANHVYLSTVYLSRLFKLQTGENYSDYMLRVRMNKAIDMLREGKYKIYEISNKVGYKSSKYFTRLFKKYTGYTPTDYLRIVLEVSDVENEE